MTSDRSLTIVIPTKDRPESLQRVLRHLAATAPEAEIIVVDDGSREPVRVPAPARVVRNEESMGHGPARNRGAELASGELLAFLDDDVLPSASAWTRLTRLVTSHPLAWAAPVVVTEGDAVGPSAEAADHVLMVEYLPTCVLLTTPSAFHAIGGFDESFTALDDFEVTTRARHAGHVLFYDPHTNAIHADARRGFRDSTLRMYDWIEATPRMWAKAAEVPLDSWTYGTFCTAMFPRRSQLRIAARLLSRPRLWGLYKRLLPQRPPPPRVAEMVSALAHVRAAHMGLSTLSPALAHELCVACRNPEHSTWLIRRVEFS